MEPELSTNTVHRLLADEDTPDWLLRQMVEEDPDRSRPFAPVLRAKRDRLAAPELEPLGGMDQWNNRVHKKRQKKYREALENGYAGPIIVSEGDSWFLYPLLIRETIDHLYDRYAINSWGAAGDDLKQILEQDQFLPALIEEQADIFLISGGGNDVLGNVEAILQPFNESFKPDDYPNGNFDDALDRLDGLFEQVFSRVSTEAPDVRTYCHGYDYALPERNGKWLGKPMRKKLGIEDAGLQRAIVRVLVDRFNDRLAALAAKYAPFVTYVNCRGTVPNQRDWYDEIHPNSDGFTAVASQFVRAIEQI